MKRASSTKSLDPRGRDYEPGQSGGAGFHAYYKRKSNISNAWFTDCGRPYHPALMSGTTSAVVKLADDADDAYKALWVVRHGHNTDFE